MGYVEFPLTSAESLEGISAFAACRAVIISVLALVELAAGPTQQPRPSGRALVLIGQHRTISSSHAGGHCKHSAIEYDLNQF